MRGQIMHEEKFTIKSIFYSYYFYIMLTTSTIYCPYFANCFTCFTEQWR